MDEKITVYLFIRNSLYLLIDGRNVSKLLYAFSYTEGSKYSLPNQKVIFLVLWGITFLMILV